MRFFLPPSTLALILAVSAQMMIPATALAAASESQIVASGKGSGHDDDDDRDDDRSGKSGKGRSGSDDRGADDSSGSSNSGGSSSSSSSSNSSSNSSGTDGSSDDSSNGASSSGSSNSDDGPRSSSSSSPASSSDSASGSSSLTRSSRQIIEGKTRRQINGFQAEFSIRREVRFDREKFRAEASSLNLGAGTRLSVCLGGSSLGGVVLNSFNYGELELDSRRGQTIPNFSGGETVELRRDSCGGEVVMAATFGVSSSSTVGGGSSSPSVQDDSLIEGKSRRFLNGFEAEFSVRLERRPDRDKFRAEAESLNLGEGTRLDVCFQGAALGDIFLNSFNYGELELDSRLGHSFPIFRSGDTVELRQGGCGGSLVMAASFGASAATASATSGASSNRSEIEGKTRRVLQSFEAEFSVRFERRFDRDKIRAEVSNLNYPEGSSWAVCFSGSSLGNLRLNAIHFAELELDTRLGHTVPVLQAGDLVSLHEGASCSSGAAMSVRMGTGN